MPTQEIRANSQINNVDSDGTLAANNDNNLPTQKAVKTYVDARTFTDVIAGHGARQSLPSGTTYSVTPWATGIFTPVMSFNYPETGTIRNLTVRITSSQPASGNLVFTLYINNVATAITVTVPAGSSSGAFSDSVHTAAYTAGQNIYFQVDNNASSNSAGIGGCAVIIDVPLN